MVKVMTLRESSWVLKEVLFAVCQTARYWHHCFLETKLCMWLRHKKQISGQLK